MMLRYQMFQHDDQSCGRIVLNVFLANAFQNVNYLWLPTQHNEKHSFADLVEQGRKHGYGFRAVKLFHFPTLKKVKEPFIALIYPANPHYVLVMPERHSLRVFDPSTGEKRFSYRTFWAMFTQYALLPTRIASPTVADHATLFKPFFRLINLVYFLILSVLASLFLLIPPFQGRWEMLGLLGLIMLGIVGHRMLDYQQRQRAWLIHYQGYLQSFTQFETFIRLVKSVYSDHLRSFTLSLLGMVISLYLLSVHVWLWVLYTLYVVGSLGIDTWIYPRFQALQVRLQEEENKVSFPIQLKTFDRIQQQTFRYALAYLSYHLFIGGFGIFLVYMYMHMQSIFHFNHFLTGITCFFSIFTWFDARRHHRQRRFQHYQQMDTILNPK